MQWLLLQLEKEGVMGSGYSGCTTQYLEQLVSYRDIKCPAVPLASFKCAKNAVIFKEAREWLPDSTFQNMSSSAKTHITAIPNWWIQFLLNF